MLTAQLSPNKYYIYVNDDLIAWDIYADQENRGFVRYFSKVLQSVEQQLPNSGLTFYVTMTEMQKLPSYGKDVVVLILGDEFYRIPKYCYQVGAVFKCYGIHQIRQLPKSYFQPSPSHIGVLAIAQALKNLVHRLPFKLHYTTYKVRKKLKNTSYHSDDLPGITEELAPIYDIPLGYYNSEELPIKDIEERSYDASFDGSIVNLRYPIWSFRYWAKTPKAIAREQMVSSLEKFRDKYPQFRIKLSTTSSFAAKNEMDTGSYSDNMMNTKVCLVPRGTTLESYRLFEAMRYGCVIITEVLPHRWFYDGSPIVQLGDWQNLERILKQILKDGDLLQELHRQTLEWWETKCSETAVGEYIAQKLSSDLLANQL